MKGSLELQCTHIYINCTDEFHMLRHRVVRCIIMYNSFVCMVEKNVRLMYLCFLFSATSFLSLYYIFVWDKELLGLKSSKQTTKNLHNEKSYHVTLLHVMSLYLMPFLDYSTRWWELKPYAISNILWHALNHLLITT